MGGQGDPLGDVQEIKFDHTNKWYMHNPANVLENDTHKLLWDFDIQTDNPISARRPDLVIINKIKRTCKIVDFASPDDHRIKLKEGEKKDKHKGTEKTMEPVGNNYTNRDWCFWYCHQRIIKGTKGLGSRRTSEDHPNYNIIENGQNTEKSAGVLKRIAVS